MWTHPEKPWENGICTTYGNVVVNGSALIPALRTAKTDFVKKNHETIKRNLGGMREEMKEKGILDKMTSDVVNEQLKLVNNLLSEFEKEVQPA
jgi:hypothetical protein